MFLKAFGPVILEWRQQKGPYKEGKNQHPEYYFHGSGIFHVVTAIFLKPISIFFNAISLVKGAAPKTRRST